MLKLEDDPSLSEEVRKGLKKYERGQHLLSILDLPVWGDVLDLLREDIDAAKKDLETYRDSDAQMVLRLLAELQGKQKALAFLERKARSLTALVNDPPPELQRYITY